MALIAVILLLVSPFTAFIPVVGMAYILYKQRVPIPLNPINVGLLLLFTWSMISAFLNKDLLSIIGSYGILVYFVIVVYMQYVCKSKAVIERVIQNIWRVGTLTAVIGIVEKILSYTIDMTWFSRLFWTINYVPTQEVYRIISTFGNPNVAGDMFAALFLLSLYLVLAHHGWKRLPYILTSVLFVIAMSFTGSKGAALGLELGLLAYSLFTRNFQNRVILIGLFFGIIALLVFVPELNHSLNSRTEIWKKCYILFKEHPIEGWGLFGIYKKTGEVHGHNVIVSILTTLGTTGFLIFTGIQIYLIYCMRFLKQRGIEILAVLVSVQVLILGHGIIDFTLLLPQVGVIYFGALSMVSALASRYMTFPNWDWANGNLGVSNRVHRLRKSHHRM